MLHHENIINTLDKFKTAVYLKDASGRYLSMNRTGIELMSGYSRRVLGKTTYELFDHQSAQQMIEHDQSVMKNGRVHASEFPARDRLTGHTLHMFNTKTAVFSPSGKALGVIGISIVNSNDMALYNELCKLLPQFVQRKQPHLLGELLELRTVSEFLKAHQIH